MNSAITIRDLYLTRRSINTKRVTVLGKLIEKLGKGTWDCVQRKTQRLGLLNVILSNFHYIQRLSTADEMQEEYKRMLEDISDNIWYSSLIKIPTLKFILEVDVHLMTDKVATLETEMATLDKEIIELLEGKDSETYADYLEFTDLGSESTQLKINMNTISGRYGTCFFN